MCPTVKHQKDMMANIYQLQTSILKETIFRSRTKRKKKTFTLWNILFTKQQYPLEPILYTR